VEVYHDAQWGTICDKNWGQKEAEVVCKELGYSGAIFAIKKAHSGRGTGPVCSDNCVFVSNKLSGFHLKNNNSNYNHICDTNYHKYVFL